MISPHLPKPARTGRPRANDRKTFSDGMSTDISATVTGLSSNTAYKFQVGDVEFRQKKASGRYYLRDLGSIICTLSAAKDKIVLTYSTKQTNLLEASGFVRDVSNIRSQGIGHFQSSIESTDGIQKAIPLIRKVYQSKKQK